MKKISLLLSGFMVIMLIGSMSCKKKTTDPADQPPSISLQTGGNYISASKTVVVKDSLKFGVRATPNSSSGANLTGLVFARTFNGNTYDTTYILPTYNVDLSTIANSAVGAETFSFAIVDANGASASVHVVITTILPTSSPNKSSATDPEKTVSEKPKVWIVR
ncbi:MAG: hypothetical protein NT004_16270 [Bacteroidetes bacterium]|nr:hypothetical protein [Bacteroidota bacterium]